MKKIYYIIIISFLLITCKSSNEVNPITTLELTVLYNKTLVGGATVYLFADSSDYQTAIKGSEISQSIPTKVTGSNGTVTFSGLAAQNYWIYVTYEQNGKAYNNQDSTHKLQYPLILGSLTKAEIDLQQSPYYLNFTTKGSLIIGTDTISLNSSGSTPINKNPGTYSYKITGGSCPFVIGKITINGDLSSDTIPVQPTPCTGGIITFWTNSTTYGPITIVLGNSEAVGTITTSRTTAPISTTDISNTVYIYSDYDSTYSYTATSDSCIWTDNFILSDSLKTIELKAPCQK